MGLYSVDEVFIDVTPYLSYYHMTAHELARILLSRRVLSAHIKSIAHDLTLGLAPCGMSAKILLAISVYITAFTSLRRYYTLLKVDCQELSVEFFIFHVAFFLLLVYTNR